MFNSYKIWNANKNKIMRVKNIIFDESLCYNSTNINLNQFINELFIELNFLELIQLSFNDIIEIDLKKNLNFNLYQSKNLSKLNLYNNIESSD